MSLPDENFQMLLADYARDTKDNGFSEAVVTRIAAQSQSEARIRRYGIMGAILVGGAIAGTQILQFSKIFDGAAISGAFSSLPLVPLAAAIFIPFMVWLLEQREISL
ncbi:MAG: hypothetical protein HKN36_01270 [Hellea sp.]|nr:hypothetical protein [Hellea sp.]